MDSKSPMAQSPEGREVNAGERLRRLEHDVAVLRDELHRIAAGLAGGPGRPRMRFRCEVEGCGREHSARGLCSKHYQAYRRMARRSAEDPVPAGGRAERPPGGARGPSPE